jgi:glycine hydroxymethyltransferase
VLDGLATNPDGNAIVESGVRARVMELCGRFPIYSGLMS